MKFSAKKFESLDSSSRETKVLQFIDEIERNWEDIGIRQQLIINFSVFLSFFHTSGYVTASERLYPEMNRREFLKIVVPIEQKLHRYLKDHNLYIKKMDGDRKRHSLPLVIVLDNLRSSFNTGAIIRTAECFGITDICFCGYTPDNEKVAQTAMGTRELIHGRHFSQTRDAIRTLKAEGYKIYALETAEKAEAIYDANFTLPGALIVGNEALGISSELLAMADAIYEIPLSGWKNSLNVGVATAIAISEFHRRR